MSNDLRKNPRFLASQGVPATIQLPAQTVNGAIHNFSSTGFALVISEELASLIDASLEVRFVDGKKQEIKLAAVVTNQLTATAKETRLGCKITDMGDHANAYFSFLATLVGKQGLIMSMATKPVKYREPGAG